MTRDPRSVPRPTASLPSHVRVHPGRLTGTVTPPGDKSVSHRALILGAMVGASVPVRGLVPSADVAATAGALERLGVRVDLAGADGWEGRVTGPVAEPDDVLDCGNSGTALRLLAGVAAGVDGVSVLTGDASLRRRPVDRVRVPLTMMGAAVDARGGGRLPPLVVRGGSLRGITYESPVASAQVKSCVLLAGLRADGPTTVVSPLASRDHTERLVSYLGGDVERVLEADGRERVTIHPGVLRAAAVEVPGDPSGAAFWLVAAAAGAGTVTTAGVCANPTRLGVISVLELLGAEVELRPVGEAAGEPVADLTAAASKLGGARIEGGVVVDAIDELPVLALAGAVSRDGLEVGGASELRVKESDRVASLAAALRALGIEIEERPDGYRVAGGQRPGPGRVDAAGDHRIAMTAAVAGVLASGPVEVTGFEVVATSYPGFLDDLRRLGGEVEVLG